MENAPWFALYHNEKVHCILNIAIWLSALPVLVSLPPCSLKISFFAAAVNIVVYLIILNFGRAKVEIMFKGANNSLGVSVWVLGVGFGLVI